ncbi:multidrug efflux SMR transporter [Rossellomorea vietnamensis]|uniref:Multidrug efflux SMR transporter n=1 Tax=Rossellomorea vietnamensis TaxID=218284 RepID=A0A5D4MHD6_9BACI|nr:multidrug efflux SMR transporter [Rossellomorea vietnamensis]TYS01305.1 multidrug efflux SMR transporter [Rossellomorea vietnamensis]
MNRSWFLVIIAGIIEVLWAIGLKHSDDFLSWSATILLIYFSFVVLIKATQKLPVATAYAVFTGIGTAGTVVVEILIFGEPFSGTKLFFIFLLLSGVIGLKLVTPPSDEKEGAI